MKMHHLRDLLAITEKGSINAAAKHLGIAQPALSRSVRELEHEIGVPLLERQSTGTVLTPMGVLFARRATSAVNELRRAREEIQQLQGAVHGTVVACVSSVSQIAFMSEALRPFYRSYPNVKLRIIEGVYPTVETRLKSGAIDFYIGAAPEGGPAPDLQQVKLFDNTRVVLARRGHPLAGARSLSELVDTDWVTTSITDHAESEFSNVFLRFDLPVPRLALISETALTWITAVANTDMLIMQPVQWAESPVITGLLAPIYVQEVIAAPAIVLIRRSSIPPTPAAEYLCDMLRRPASRYNRE
ncbi:MAG: LysR substrate-binding domain-containing protein [Pseudomonadota bacterium]